MVICFPNAPSCASVVGLQHSQALARIDQKLRVLVAFRPTALSVIEQLIDRVLAQRKERVQ